MDELGCYRSGADMSPCKDDAREQAVGSQKLTTTTPVSSPIIIGNMNAASALSSVLQNNSDSHAQTVKGVTDTTVQVFLSPGNYLAKDSSQTLVEDSAEAVGHTSPASGDSQPCHKPGGKVSLLSADTVIISPEQGQPASNACPSVDSLVGPLEETSSRSELLSSDTVIIPQSQQESNLILSSLLAPSSQSLTNLVPVKLMVNENMSDTSDKKPSLLPNISNRSVSLNSIPSISLFRPGLCQGVSSDDGYVATGTNKLPSWLSQLFRNNRHAFVGNNRDETETTSHCLGKATSQTSEASLRESSKGHGKDSTKENVTPSREVKQPSLERSDTLILDSDLSTQHRSLPESLEKLPSGVSLASVSTVSADVAAALLDDETGLEWMTLNKEKSQVSKTESLDMEALSQAQAIEGTISFSNLAQLGLNCRSQISAEAATGAVLLVYQPQHSNQSEIKSEPKETQTDMSLGTNTVYFHPVDYLADQSSTDFGHVPATVLAISTSASPEVAVSQPQQPPLLVSGSATPTNSPQNIAVNTKVASSENLSSSNSAVNISLTLGDAQAFKCSLCDEKLNSKAALVDHMKTHKTFKCDLCNASFSRLGNYTRHKKIHNLQSGKQNGYKCEDCGRDFLQRCDLKRHMLIHSKQEPYRCDICGKGYIRRSDLVVHKRFHNKDRAFQCPHCSKKYFQSGDLNRHIRSAHKPNNHLTCGHCDRKYACEATLIRHMKAVHKDIILQAVNKKLSDLQPGEEGALATHNNILFTMKQKSLVQSST